MPLNDEESTVLDGLFTQSNTRLSIEKASHRNPDTYADYLKLSKGSKLPVDTIERNVNEVKRRDTIAKVDFIDLGDNYPHLNEWLSDENNASVAIDDLDVLKNMERSIWMQQQPWYKLRPSHAMKNFTKTVPESFMQGIRGAGAALIDYAQSAVSAQQQSIEMVTGIKPEDDPIGQKLQESLTAELNSTIEAIKAGDKKIESLTPRDLSVLEEGMRSGLESTVRNVPGLVATLALKNPTPMLTMMGAQTGFESYGSARVEGKSPSVALTYGAIDASIEVLTEMIPTKALVGMMESAGLKGVGKEALKFTVTEIGGEQAATLLQSINAYAFGLDEELKKAETVDDMIAIQGRRQAVTLFASLVGSATQTGIGATANLVATRASAKNLETTLDSMNDQEILENIITYSQGSKTRGRAQEQFESFLKAVGPDNAVYIPADVADRIIDPPSYIAEQLNEDGIDIEIPLDKFSSEIVPNEEIMSVIRPFMKMNPNRLNATELKDKENVDIKAVMEKAQKSKDIKTEADTIYEQVKDQIVGTGRQAESTARLSAQLIPAYAAAKAEGLGITPKAVYEAMGLRVVGPGAEVKPTGGKVILDQAKAQGYEGEVTGEAQEWVRAKAKGLDMSQEARLQRAKSMGFDTEQVMYHGTTKDFSEFSIKAQQVSGDIGEFGIFFTDNPVYASAYAENIRGETLEYGKVIPVYLSLTKPKVESIEKMEDMETEWSKEEITKYKKDLIDQGYNGIEFKGKTSEYVVFDPSQIRSVNAAFDPDYVESPNLLAQAAPTLQPKQDFGDIKITDIYTVEETGEKVEVTQDAQKVWDQTQKRKNMIAKLGDCLGG